MKSINSYIVEKLQLNKQTNVYNSYEEMMQKIVKACALNINPKEFDEHLYDEMYGIIEKWLRDNKIEDINIYMQDSSYQHLKRYKDKIDTSLIKVNAKLTHHLLKERRGDNVYEKEGNNIFLYGNEAIIIYRHLCFKNYEGFTNFFIVKK